MSCPVLSCPVLPSPRCCVAAPILIVPIPPTAPLVPSTKRRRAASGDDNDDDGGEEDVTPPRAPRRRRVKARISNVRTAGDTAFLEGHFPVFAPPHQQLSVPGGNDDVLPIEDRLVADTFHYILSYISRDERPREHARLRMVCKWFRRLVDDLSDPPHGLPLLRVAGSFSLGNLRQQTHLLDDAQLFPLLDAMSPVTGTDTTLTTLLNNTTPADDAVVDEDTLRALSDTRYGGLFTIVGVSTPRHVRLTYKNDRDGAFTLSVRGRTYTLHVPATILQYSTGDPLVDISDGKPALESYRRITQRFCPSVLSSTNTTISDALYTKLEAAGHISHSLAISLTPMCFVHLVVTATLSLAGFDTFMTDPINRQSYVETGDSHSNDNFVMQCLYRRAYHDIVHREPSPTSVPLPPTLSHSVRMAHTTPRLRAPANVKVTLDAYQLDALSWMYHVETQVIQPQTTTWYKAIAPIASVASIEISAHPTLAPTLLPKDRAAGKLPSLCAHPPLTLAEIDERANQKIKDANGLFPTYARSFTSRGALLCDEMGLGKTIEMLAHIANTLQPLADLRALSALAPPPALVQSRATLVLVPNALVEQWSRRAHTVFGTDTNVRFLCTRPHRTLLDKDEILEVPLVVMSFEFLDAYGKDKTGDQLLPAMRRLEHISFARVVVDEAHLLFCTTPATRWSHLLEGRIYWALTATPPTELSHMLDLFRFLRIRVEHYMGKSSVLTSVFTLGAQKSIPSTWFTEGPGRSYFDNLLEVRAFVRAVVDTCYWRNTVSYVLCGDPAKVPFALIEPHHTLFTVQPSRGEAAAARAMTFLGRVKAHQPEWVDWQVPLICFLTGNTSFIANAAALSVTPGSPFVTHLAAVLNELYQVVDIVHHRISHRLTTAVSVTMAARQHVVATAPTGRKRVAAVQDLAQHVKYTDFLTAMLSEATTALDGLDKAHKELAHDPMLVSALNSKCGTVRTLGTKFEAVLHYIHATRARDPDARFMLFSGVAELMGTLHTILGDISIVLAGNVYQKAQNLARFTAGKCPVLLLDPTTTHGLDLPMATHVIDLDSGRNSGRDIAQAVGRAVRRGQTARVNVVTFVFKDTAEHAAVHARCRVDTETEYVF